jgi:hypothetical protein
MNTELQNEIIEQIKLSDDVILLEIQEILKGSTIHDEVPLYVKQRLEKSIQQTDNKQYIAHEEVMKKYSEWK